MLEAREFWQVDVFTDRIFLGNPAAVVLDGNGLDAGTMQAIAREMNLSETVFILTPGAAGADYRARIFTPRSELPFAGHPTLAAAFAIVTQIAERTGLPPPVLRQECGIGVVPIEVARDGNSYRLMMTEAPPRYRALPDFARDACAALLGCGRDDIAELPVEIVSTGVPWLLIPLRSPDRLARLTPNLTLIEERCRTHGAVGVTAFTIGALSPDCAVKLRSFAPGEGIAEDPVCGSGNGSVLAYIAEHRLFDGDEITYLAEQGDEIARAGRVFAEARRSASGGLEIRIGGNAVRAIEGRIRIG